jgi:hypothetical protein
LGKFQHAHEVESSDDALLSYKTTSCPPHIGDILSPHTVTLATIISDSSLESHMLDSLPAVEYARERALAKRHRTRRGYEQLHLVPFTGDISDLEQAQIANWIYHNVPGAKKSPMDWIGRVAMAHALTIVIASHHKTVLMKHSSLDSLPQEQQEETLLSLAWQDIQTNGSHARSVNVEQECLRLLEERMFEESAAAGKAGAQQWGLDSAGPHQSKWSPYENGASSWSEEYVAYSDESELFKVSDSLLPT